MRTVFAAVASLAVALFAGIPVNAQTTTIHKIKLTADIQTAVLNANVGDEIHFVRPKMWIAPIPEFLLVTTDGNKAVLFKQLTPNDPPGSSEMTLEIYRVERTGRGFIRVSTTPVVPYPKVTNHQYLKIEAR